MSFGQVLLHDQLRSLDRQSKAEVKRQIKELDKQQDAIVERLVETKNPKVVSALEDKIAKLDHEKLLLKDKRLQNKKPAHTVGEIFEPLSGPLSNPWKTYEKRGLTTKKPS